MSAITSNVLLLFLLVYLLVSIWILLGRRKFGGIILNVALIAGFAYVLHIATGFPTAERAFGGANPSIIVIALLICVILGMMAHYFFFLGRKKIRVREFARPFAVSPIILLPLLGSIESTGSITEMQTISLAFLAFQNGFFWKAVFDRIEKNEGVQP